MFFSLHEKPIRAKQHIHPMFRLERQFNEILARVGDRQKEGRVLAQDLRVTCNRRKGRQMHVARLSVKTEA